MNFWSNICTCGYVDGKWMNGNTPLFFKMFPPFYWIGIWERGPILSLYVFSFLLSFFIMNSPCLSYKDIWRESSSEYNGVLYLMDGWWHGNAIFQCRRNSTWMMHMVVLTSSEEVLAKWCAQNLDQKVINSNSLGSQQFDKVQWRHK